MEVESFTSTKFGDLNVMNLMHLFSSAVHNSKESRQNICAEAIGEALTVAVLPFAAS